jgi:hypothetical protein
MDSDKLRIARDKLTRAFRYLEALNQHRNPAKRQIPKQPWSLWLHGLPNHPTIKRGAAKSSSSKSKAKENQAGENDGVGEFVLKVQRPVLTRPPWQHLVDLHTNGIVPQPPLAAHSLPGVVSRKFPPHSRNRNPCFINGLEAWR